MLSSAAYGNGILHSEQKILAKIYVSIICTHMVTHMVDFCRPSHISCIANAMVKYAILPNTVMLTTIIATYSKCSVEICHFNQQGVCRGTSV